LPYWFFKKPQAEETIFKKNNSGENQAEELTTTHFQEKQWVPYSSFKKPQASSDEYVDKEHFQPRA